MAFKIVIPQSNPTDGSGRFSREWQLFLLALADAINNGSGTVVNIGTLTSPAIILGAGTSSVRAGPLPVTAGFVLTDNGPGNDPSYQAAAGGGITAGTGDVTFSGTGSVVTTIALGVEHAWTSTQYVTNTVLTDASTITPNVSTTTNNFYLLTTTAVGASRTMALPTGVQPGMVVNVQVKQPSSGGPCAIVWAAGYLWGQGGGSAAPIPSQAANAVELYSFIVQQDLNLHGVMIGQSGPAGAGYGGTSATSQGTGTGSKTFAIQAGLAWQVGAYVRFTSSSTGEYMQGTVTAYALASMTINVDVNVCTTTHTDWMVNPAGVPGPTGSTGATGSTGPAGAASSAGPSGTAGRLTLTAGVPITTTDVTAATSVVWEPYKGNQIQLWDGSNWTTYTSASLSLALGTLTASICYDIFMRQVAGVPTLDMLAWTSATARATAVTYQDGRLCKSGDKTRLLLGTIYARTTTSCNDAGGYVTTNVGGTRDLSNIYNQVVRPAGVIDTTSSWTYTTATYRQVRATAGNKIELVVSDPAGEWIEVRAQIMTENSSANNYASGVGIDSTSVNSAQLTGGTNAANVNNSSQAQYSGYLAPGYHAINWLEIAGATGTQTWFGTAGLPYWQGGMHGWIRA